jgi:uncharacterized protein (DUF2147 family)
MDRSFQAGAHRCRALAAIFLAAASLSALAQNTPAGLWRSSDDKTGEAKAEIRVIDSGGVLSGRIEKRLLKTARPEDVCTECSDDRKGKPMLGLEILRGARQSEGQAVWEGGKILDPENGRSYTLKMTPIDDGKKLEVRGSFGPFGRTQTWARIQ